MVKYHVQYQALEYVNENKNCAFGCFHFENPKIKDILAYCELLVAEYGRPGYKNIVREYV